MDTDSDLRKQYDQMFTSFVLKQRMFRGVIEGKREEVWNHFNQLVRPYYEDAMKYRDLANS